MDHVFKIHGFSREIVSDGGLIFSSTLWVIEVMNKCLEMYLMFITEEKPKERALHLPLVEFLYNTNYHSAIGTTPFTVLYSQLPPYHIPHLAKDTKVDTTN